MSSLPPRTRGLWKRNAGFTLIELVVVVAIMGTIVAIALPQLLPVISFSTHEGSARRLAGYGRTAISHAGLMHEQVTVFVDLNQQEYWCERWPNLVPDDDSEGDGEKKETLANDPIALMKYAQDMMDQDVDDEDAEKFSEEAMALLNEFDLMERRALLTRARRVVHDHAGILSEIGPLFDKEFSLDRQNEQPEPEEIFDPLLERSRMPSGVFINSVRVGETMHHNGVVEIEISPEGLEEVVLLFIENEDGEFFTVEWDPVVGGGIVRQGKVDGRT